MKVEFFSSKKEIIEGWRFNASYSAFFPFGKNSKKRIEECLLHTTHFNMAYKARLEKRSELKRRSLSPAQIDIAIPVITEFNFSGSEYFVYLNLAVKATKIEFDNQSSSSGELRKEIVYVAKNVISEYGFWINSELSAKELSGESQILNEAITFINKSEIEINKVMDRFNDGKSEIFVKSEVGLGIKTNIESRNEAIARTIKPIKIENEAGPYLNS
jgi:hypothetical protein